jgi:hypothetical protein
MRFKTMVLAAGKTATGMEVPPKVVEAFGSGKKPPVSVTINGYTYRSTVAVMGGRFMVGISAEVREGAGVKAGDTISVDMELDTKPRDVDIPAELAKALARDAKARKVFDGLSYSRKRQLIDPIAKAKTAETRKRNTAKALASLKA